MISILPILYIFATALSYPPTIPSHLKIENCSFGEAYAFNATGCEISLLNDGDQPIKILNAKAENENDSIAPFSLTIAPHSRSYLLARLHTGNSIAIVNHQFQIRTDELGHENRSASASGFVMTSLDNSSPEIDFGVVDLNNILVNKQIILSSHDTAEFRIVKIIEKPSYIEADIDSTGHVLIAKFRENAEFGLYNDFIKLDISTPQQKEAWVRVQGDVHGDIVPDSNPVDLGLMRFGNSNEHLIKIKNRTGKNINTGRIKLENIRGVVKILPCEPQANDCRIIKLTVSDTQPTGSILGRILVYLPDYKRNMSINLWGLIVPKDFKIKTLVNKKDSPSEEGVFDIPSDPSINNGKTIDFNNSLINIISQANQPIPLGTGPLLKWTVANSQLIYGYEIFRSNSDVGTFVRVNESTIKSRKNQGDSSSYQWRDSTAESGKTYWYYIGAVYNDGHKQQLSGPQKFVAH